ncbi:MAG: hypothetical protein AB1414_03265 [bacterium]
MSRLYHGTTYCWRQVWQPGGNVLRQKGLHLSSIWKRRRKTVIFPSARGLTFLGFRLYPGSIRAGKRCGKRFIARLKQLQRQYAEGVVDLKKIKQVIASYNGHLSHAATLDLRTEILSSHPFVRKHTKTHPYALKRGVMHKHMDNHLTIEVPK